MKFSADSSKNKLRGIARSLLSGVLVPLSFCDYFGQTGWVFASCFGSHRGGVLALLMFTLGALIVKETAISKPFDTALIAVIPFFILFSGKLLSKYTLLVIITALLYMCSGKYSVILPVLAALTGELFTHSSDAAFACMNTVADGALFFVALRLYAPDNAAYALTGAIVSAAVCII